MAEIERYDVNEEWEHAGSENGLLFQADAVAYRG